MPILDARFLAFRVYFQAKTLEHSEAWEVNYDPSLYFSPAGIMNTTPSIYLREPCPEDENSFLSSMQKSKDFHFPFVIAPQTPQDFQTYLQKFQVNYLNSYELFLTT